MLRQQEEYLAKAEQLESQGPDYYVDPRLEGGDDEDDGTQDFGFSHTLGSLSLMDDDSEEVFQPSSVSLIRQSSQPSALSLLRPGNQNASTMVRPATSSGSVASKITQKSTRS